MAEKPLKDLTIVITRAASQADEFASLLEGLGARTVAIPVIEISPLDSPELRESLRSVNSYDWIIFTSVNGAEIFLERLKNSIGPGELKPLICAIGPGTAGRIEEMGFSVSLLPSLFQAEGVTEEFRSRLPDMPTGQSILIPRALQAREILPQSLREMGYSVDVVPVYRTDFPETREAELRELLSKASPDMITFTSSSTVTNFLLLAGGHINLDSYRFASIGPITSETAAKAGLKITVTARESTLPALAAAIAEYFTENRPEK